jgi:hypothetical protein
MSNNPQQPSSGQPEDRRRGRDELSDIERDLRRGQQRGSRGTQRGSDQDENLPGRERGSGQEQRAERGTYPAAEPARGSHPVGREPHAEPHRSRKGLYAALGIVGLLLLGGLLGGLVAAFTGSAAKSTSAALHPATHASAPSTTLLQQFQNVGPHNSANFKVSSSPVTSHYTYSCPSGASSFVAQTFNTSGTDMQTIANTSGTGGTSSAVLHPAAGGIYHVYANTRCQYRIQVYGK